MSSIELGSTIIDALINLGMRDIVLAPGSRSAALALAADRADRVGVLRLHVRVDERVASFTALGLAKAQREPRARRHGGPGRGSAAAVPHRGPPRPFRGHRRQPDHRPARGVRPIGTRRRPAVV